MVLTRGTSSRRLKENHKFCYIGDDSGLTRVGIVIGYHMVQSIMWKDYNKIMKLEWMLGRLTTGNIFS